MNQHRRGLPSLSDIASGIVALLVTAGTAQAQVGVLQGVVAGVQPGTVLAIFKGEAKVADITVGADGKYSVALGTGLYTVKCPNGTTPKVAALNGASSTNINCQ